MKLDVIRSQRGWYPGVRQVLYCVLFLNVIRSVASLVALDSFSPLVVEQLSGVFDVPVWTAALVCLLKFSIGNPFLLRSWGLGLILATVNCTQAVQREKFDAATRVSCVAISLQVLFETAILYGLVCQVSNHL